MKKSVLIISIGFLPNIGGLETHLKDLMDELVRRDWKVVVLTYQPLNTPVLGRWIERGKNLIILRLPVLRGLFYKLLKIPFMEFLFLEPLLFLTLPIILIKYPDIEVVNAQGVIAGFAGAFWSKIFKKRYVISIQSVYNFPKQGLYREVCKRIFTSADKIIAISTLAKTDIESLGINSKKIQLYTNWENKDNYTPINKDKAKEKLGFKGKFIVSFFGRLVEEKGVKVLLDAIKLASNKITFAIYGEGPLVDLVEQASKNYKNVIYMKTIHPQNLPLHYSAADLLVMPSLHEEGFGRVAAGALLCGTPVIASNRGALPEVVNDSVGKIVNPTPQDFAKAVNFFYNNKIYLKKRASKSREYAVRKFSRKNVGPIIKSYL